MGAVAAAHIQLDEGGIAPEVPPPGGAGVLAEAVVAPASWRGAAPRVKIKSEHVARVIDVGKLDERRACT